MASARSASKRRRFPTLAHQAVCCQSGVSREGLVKQDEEGEIRSLSLVIGIWLPRELSRTVIPRLNLRLFALLADGRGPGLPGRGCQDDGGDEEQRERD